MTGPALKRLRQIAKPDSFDDTLSAAAVAAIEAAASDFHDFQEALLSQLKRIIHGDAAGDWNADPASAFGGDASLKALYALVSGGVSTFVVPSAVSVGDLVYQAGGDYTADRADNSSTSTSPAVGVVTSKPTSTSAVVRFWGELALFSGMTPGLEQFLGTTGGLVEPGSLPSSPGSVIQRVGVALNATTLLLLPGEHILL